MEVLTNAVTNVANVMESGYDGAEILGIHFEGPYLDMKYKGAQPDQYIVKPTIEQFEHYQKAARGHIRYVTLATEHDEDFALTTAQTVWWVQHTASAPCTARSSVTAATPPPLL